MDKDLIEDKCSQMIDQFNERKIKSVMFYSILQYLLMMDTCKIVFVNDDKKTY